MAMASGGRGTSPARPSKSRRLVASNACENCRNKHIRCVSLPSEARCNRCNEQNLTCLRAFDRRKTRKPSPSPSSALPGADCNETPLEYDPVSNDRGYRETDTGSGDSMNRESASDMDFSHLTGDERYHLQRCLSAYRGGGVAFYDSASASEYTNAGDVNFEQRITPTRFLNYANLPQNPSPSDPGVSSSYGPPRSYAAITTLSSSTEWTQGQHDIEDSQGAQDEAFDDAGISMDILKNAYPSKMDCIIAWAKNIEILPLGTDLRTAADLLNLYFLRHYTIWPCLSRVLFYSSFIQNGPYCTPLLLNAILALGGCFSSSPLIRSQDESISGATAFFTRAKQLLLSEIDSPNVMTVQALTILAQREGLCGRKASQSHYITTAIQLALDMKLHQRQSGFAAEAAYIRSRTFWGLWCTTQEYSSLTGQPSLFHALQPTIPYPPTWNPEAFDWRVAFRTGDMVVAAPGSAPSSFNDAFAMARLYDRGIGQIFFSMGNRTIATQLECLRAHTGNLLAAIGRLPPDEPAPLAPDIGTKILYHGVCILANRPFCNLPADLSVDHLPHPRHVCQKAAAEIIRLSGILHGLPEGGPLAFLDCHVHTLLSAASVVLAESPSGSPTAYTESQLVTILSCLRNLAPYRPLAQIAIANFQTLRSGLVMEENTPPCRLPSREGVLVQAQRDGIREGTRPLSRSVQEASDERQIHDDLHLHMDFNTNHGIPQPGNASTWPLTSSLEASIGVFGEASTFASADGVNDMTLNLNYLDTYLALFQQDL